MVTRKGRENAAYLMRTFKDLWKDAGESVDDLPEYWQEQVVVWEAEGISENELRRFLRAWASKRRDAGAEHLWRYLQVCCFNHVHPHPARPSRNRYQDDDSYWGRSPNFDPPWMGRDPGPDLP
jgi:hypothetical protein